MLVRGGGESVTKLNLDAAEVSIFIGFYNCCEVFRFGLHRLYMTISIFTTNYALTPALQPSCPPALSDIGR